MSNLQDNKTDKRQPTLDFEVPVAGDPTLSNNNSNLPETLKNSIYTPAFLRKHIGNLVKVEFLIGNSFLEDRTGILLEVGASYIVLRAVQDNNLLYCDIYSIKFVTISRQPYLYTQQFSGQPYPPTYGPNYAQAYPSTQMQAQTPMQAPIQTPFPMQ